MTAGERAVQVGAVAFLAILSGLAILFVGMTIRDWLKRAREIAGRGKEANIAAFKGWARILAMRAVAFAVIGLIAWGAVVFLGPGFKWANDKIDRRFKQYRCESLVEAEMRRTQPEIDLRMDRCDIGAAKDGTDVCFVTFLRDGTRVTAGAPTNCAEWIEIAPKMAEIRKKH